MTRNPLFENRTKFTIENVPVFFPKLFEDHYDQYEKKRRYKLTMGLPKELAEKLEDNGFSIKWDDEGNAFLDAFRNIDLKNGKTMPPPAIEFADGTPYDREQDGWIGNGTVCDLVVTSQYVKVGKNTFLPCYLEKVLIRELVPYEGSVSAGSAADLF